MSRMYIIEIEKLRKTFHSPPAYFYSIPPKINNEIFRMKVVGETRNRAPKEQGQPKLSGKRTATGRNSGESANCGTEGETRSLGHGNLSGCKDRGRKVIRPLFFF